MQQLYSKVTLLQNKIRKLGYDGYIIPSWDEFQSEYTAEYFRRLEFISGFTGSFGIAVILKEKSILYTDGRYLLQAKMQLDSTWEIREQHQPQFELENLKIAYDPMIHTEAQIKSWEQCIHISNIILVPHEGNLIDEIWHRPSWPQHNKISTLPDQIALTNQRITDISQYCKDKKCDSILITCSYSINWLLGMRGYDIPSNPIFLTYAIITPQGDITLFTEHQNNIGKYKILNISQLETILKQYSNIGYDPRQTPIKLAKLCHIQIANPCIMAKAIKSKQEIAGMKKAALIDSTASCKFFYWLYNTTHTNEIEAAEKLLSIRQTMPDFIMQSFDTISAFNQNGAIIHYRSTPQTNLQLTDGLYLCDSGGHYKFGTTDITRTILYGNPAPSLLAKYRQYYTAVLKAHIAVASLIFPAHKTTGHQVDAIARAPLWKHGKDYAHGTGHGVGYVLSVHEGPHSISRSSDNKTILQEGMIVSNEPGYYEDNAFGIRLENLLAINSSDTLDGYLKFDTITLVPFDKRLIDFKQLTTEENLWLFHYHQSIKQKLTSLFNTAEIKWLESYL